MADNQAPNTQQTTVQADSTPVQMPHRPAPLLPVAGAAVSAPMTGQGPQNIVAGESESSTPVPPPTVVHPPRPLRRSVVAQPAAATQSVQPPPVAVQSPAVLSQAMALMQTQPAFTSMMVHALNTQRTAGQKFILLVLPADQWPRCEEFDDVSLLMGRIKELIGTPCCLFPFLGHRLGITEGPNRFLQTPVGPLPLFVLPDGQTAGTEAFGWVGDSMDRPQAPMSEAPEPDVAADELGDEVGVPGSLTTDDTADTDESVVF